MRAAGPQVEESRREAERPAAGLAAEGARLLARDDEADLLRDKCVQLERENRALTKHAAQSMAAHVRPLPPPDTRNYTRRGFCAVGCVCCGQTGCRHVCVFRRRQLRRRALAAPLKQRKCVQQGCSRVPSNWALLV